MEVVDENLGHHLEAGDRPGPGKAAGHQVADYEGVDGRDGAPAHGLDHGSRACWVHVYLPLIICDRSGAQFEAAWAALLANLETTFGESRHPLWRALSRLLG